MEERQMEVTINYNGQAVTVEVTDVYKRQVHRTNNGRRISQYTCSNYTKIPCGTLCPTQHRINESAVLTLVSDTLRAKMCIRDRFVGQI